MTNEGSLNKPSRRRRQNVKPDLTDVANTVEKGGKLDVLSSDSQDRIHNASLKLLSTVGMSEIPEVVQKIIIDNGGSLDENGRLLFPTELVERALVGFSRDFTLYGQCSGYELKLSSTNVYAGSGGASPQLLDIESGKYRASTLTDLYDAARLVDKLDNIHFFARSMVAGDMETDHALDINTAFASLAGTTKHVIVSANHPSHVNDIAEMCFTIAGSAEAFHKRPFLSFNINHVTPPMRFSEEACEVLAEAARLGMPVMVNTFGQLGASSPVTIAGCVAQSNAETLAGMIFSWAINPQIKAVYGPRPMVTDLRSGGMAGGSGEQALLTAASSQMARYYNLPSSTIAGATDSKIADAQAGYEKCASVLMTSQAGANLITQAAGTLSGLMGCSFEAYVIDNDMLGMIQRTLSPIEVSEETLAISTIGDVVNDEGHFLGQSETYKRMKTDFLYPDIADRRSVEEWESDGSMDIRVSAKERAKEILSNHFPNHLSKDIETSLRDKFDIRLPAIRMRKQ